jgi:tetratricopeptide (TPR) repeat protein
MRRVLLIIFSFFALASCSDSRVPVLKGLSENEYKEYLLVKSGIDSQLDSLHRLLQKEEDPIITKMASDRIWYLWMESGLKEVDNLMRIGLEATEMKKYDIALEAFAEVIKAHPRYAEAWNKRATVNYLVGNYRESLNDIDRVLKLENRHFGAMEGKINILMQLRRYREAYRLILELKGIHPQLPGIEEKLEELNQKMGIKIA